MSSTSTNSLMKSSQRAQVYALRRACPQGSQACQYPPRFRLPGEACRLRTRQICRFDQPRLWRGSHDIICGNSLVQGSWNSLRVFQLHKGSWHVVSGMHSRWNVYWEGHFPGNFYSQSDLKSFIAAWKAFKRRYRLDGVCNGQVVYQPNKHRKKTIVFQLFWKHWPRGLGPDPPSSCIQPSSATDSWISFGSSVPKRFSWPIWINPI